MAKLYSVSLSDAERLLLQNTIKKGKAPARTTTRARILLKADRGPERQEWSDTKIAEAVEVSRPTVERLRKRAVLDGIEAALRQRAGTNVGRRSQKMRREQARFRHSNRRAWRRSSTGTPQQGRS